MSSEANAKEKKTMLKMQCKKCFVKFNIKHPLLYIGYICIDIVFGFDSSLISLFRYKVINISIKVDEYVKVKLYVKLKPSKINV